MRRYLPSLLIPRRHAAAIVALLLAAQLSLFAHAVGHDYFQDADQSHVVCGLCIAAQHLDNGLTPTAIELPQAGQAVLGAQPHSFTHFLFIAAPFQARAPPVQLPS